MSGFSHATQAIRQGILSQCQAFHRGSFLHGLVYPSRKNLPRKLLKFYKAGHYTLKIILKAKPLLASGKVVPSCCHKYKLSQQGA